MSSSSSAGLYSMSFTSLEQLMFIAGTVPLPAERQWVGSECLPFLPLYTCHYQLFLLGEYCTKQDTVRHERTWAHWRHCKAHTTHFELAPWLYFSGLNILGSPHTLTLLLLFRYNPVYFVRLGNVQLRTLRHLFEVWAFVQGAPEPGLPSCRFSLVPLFKLSLENSPRLQMKIKISSVNILSMACRPDLYNYLNAPTGHRSRQMEFFKLALKRTITIILRQVPYHLMEI